jgi:hypothetical protein
MRLHQWTLPERLHPAAFSNMVRASQLRGSGGISPRFPNIPER